MTPTIEQSKRIQIDLPEDMLKQVEELMQESSIRTKKEYINNALTLLGWAIRETREGRVIASVDEQQQKYKEILLTPLENVATLRRRRAASNDKTHTSGAR